MNRLGSYDGKDLYLATTPSLETPVAWPAPYFKLVVFIDSEQVPDTETLIRFAQTTLDAGVRYVLCAGTSGELLHDVFDEVIVANEAVYTPNEEDVIPTTWHDNEPVSEVLWQAFSFRSADRFEEGNPPVVVFALDTDSRLPELERIGTSLNDTFHRLVTKEQPKKSKVIYILERCFAVFMAISALLLVGLGFQHILATYLSGVVKGLDFLVIVAGSLVVVGFIVFFRALRFLLKGHK